MNDKKGLLAILFVMVIVLTGALIYQSRSIAELKGKVEEMRSPTVSVPYQQQPQKKLLNPPIAPPNPIIANPSIPGATDPLIGSSGPRMGFPGGMPDPMLKMREMEERMQAMMDRMKNMQPGMSIDPNFGGAGSGTSPDSDLQEDDDNYILRIELPGISKEDVELKVDGRMLTISTNRSESIRKEEPGKTFQVQRRVGGFSNTMSLPGPVEEDKISLEYDDPVLTITLPKAD